MKHTHKIFLFLLLSLIYSCTADDFETPDVKGSNKVTAILPDWNVEDETTRTSITTGPYGTPPSPVWVAGDSIGIYPDAGGDQLSFRINEGGSKTCTFDGGGWAMKSSSYTAYSPFDRSFYYQDKEALPISMTGQTQNGNDNADHLGAYDIQIAKGEKPKDGNLVFSFSRYVALARIEITAPKAATWTSVTLESDASFTTSAKMNLALETPTVTPTATSNSVTLKLENVSTTSDNLSVIAYMMLLPVDLTGKTLTVTLTDSEGETYPSEATVANDKTNFTANAARWINAVYEIPVPNNQIWYTSSDGNVVTPYKTDVFGANIVSNVYENGKGIITFDGDVTSIGNSAFNRSSNLTSITIPNSVESIGNSAFQSCEKLTSIKMPNSVTSIGNFAFSNCYGLTSITIPNSIESIGGFAFYFCSLTDITIPNSVTSIGESAFGGCLGLTSIVVESGNTVYDSRNNCNAIIITESNVLHTGCKNTIIPDGITSIGDYAFCSCGNLKNITIPNSVQSIGKCAFFSCSLIESITIPNSVITIESQAFNGCVDLESVTIPNSVITIESQAFDGCVSLESVTIPNSVKSIGFAAFGGCTSLSTIYVKPTTPPTLGNSPFYNCANGYNIYVPAESLDAYKAADGWKDLNISAVYEETAPNKQIWYTSSDGNVVTPYKTDVFGANIVSNVYENGKGIITFDGDVTSIGNSAFDRISNLTSITIPNSVTSIGSYAFFHCSLTDITIPNSVTSIGKNAFGCCLGLTSIVVESGNTVYDSRNNCNAIIITESNVLHTGCKNTIIPDGITSIGDYAFCMCGNLNSITIPNSVESIGEGAFYCCGLLEGITIPNSVITIESGAFEDCVRLTDITISNSIESIGANVFRQCISLTNITIPNSVKSIGGSAFSGCTSLSTIYVKPTTPPTLGNSPFYNCANGYNIYVPAESLDVYKAADGWKDLNISAEN